MTPISLRSDLLGYLLFLADAPRCDTAPVSRAWRCATYRVKWEVLQHHAKSRETFLGHTLFEMNSSRLFKQRSCREKERDLLLIALEKLRALSTFIEFAKPLPKPFQLSQIDEVYREISPLVQKKRDQLLTYFFTEHVAPRLPHANNPILYQYEPRTANQVRPYLTRIPHLLRQLLFTDLAPFLNLPELLTHPLLSEPQMAQLFLQACKRGDGELILSLLQTNGLWSANWKDSDLFLSGVQAALRSQSLSVLHALFAPSTPRENLELLKLGIQAELPLPHREFFYTLIADLSPAEFVQIPMERPLKKKLFKTFSKEKQGQLAELDAYCQKLFKRYEKREPHPPLPRTRLDDLTIALRALRPLSPHPL